MGLSHTRIEIAIAVHIIASYIATSILCRHAVDHIHVKKYIYFFLCGDEHASYYMSAGNTSLAHTYSYHYNTGMHACNRFMQAL